MKLLSLIIFSFSFLICGHAQDDILGTYWTPEKDGKIRVYKTGNKYYAKLTWIKDIESDKAKKPNGESTLGEVLFKDFVKKKDNLWADGVIIDPTKNKEYQCKIWLDENNDLMARGFIGISLLGRTEKFERIN